MTAISTTSSSSTSAPTTTALVIPYIMIPNPNATWQQQVAFTARLNETNNGTLYVSQSNSRDHIAYWYQELTLDQVKLYSMDPAVSIAKHPMLSIFH